MREYARLQTSVLLRRLTLQLNRAARSADDAAIHDLRVSIRRLSRCLRVFSKFYPGSSWKKVRRQLSLLMSAAAEVRDSDITLELMSETGIPKESPMVLATVAARRKAAQQLQSAIRKWQQRGYAREWRSLLELQP